MLFRVFVVAIAYGLVLLAVYFLEWRSLEVVFFIFLLPFLYSAFSLGSVGGLISGAVTGFLLIPFIPWDLRAWIPLIITLYALLGGMIGFLKRRFEHKGERGDNWEEETLKKSLNLIQIIDPKGHILKRNERSIEVLGYPSSIFDFFHPDDQKRIGEEIERAYSRGESGVELRIISQEKEALPVEIKLIRLEGEALALEMRDISEQVRLERRLWEEEARYRYLIEDAIDTLDTGILLLDKHKKVIWANKTIANFFGLDRDDMIGISMERILNKVSPLMNPQDFEKLSNNSANFTFTLKRPDKERIIEYRSIPIETKKYKGGRIDHYIDITEIKKLEMNLKERTRRLEEFTHVVSHDLKGPLRTIEAFSQFLLEDYKGRLDSEGVEYLNSIRNSSIRMKRLIDDLLKLSRIGIKPESLEKINIGEVLGDVREDLDFALEDVELKVANSFPTVFANRTRMIELLANLISNAIKYNDKSKKVVEVGWKEERNFHLFYVKDNGIGIEKQYLGRIFKIFERLNPRDDHEGTGAGLAICKRIVEEYGGRIWVKSKVGVGSTFYFTLPKR
jgi:PAS domain S-box-containing protein